MFYSIVMIKRCSSESWSSLLQLKTAEDNVHSENQSKNTINAHFKRHETRQCLLVSSHVLTLKHKAKHEYITWNLLVDGGVMGNVPVGLLHERFSGPKLVSNLIAYSNISENLVRNIDEDMSKNIIYKLVPQMELLTRSIYMLQSQINTMEREKYPNDIYIEFGGWSDISNMSKNKDMLISDGYLQAKEALKKIGF